MKNKLLATMALAAACVLVVPMTAEAATYNDGWNQDSTGWWYWHEDSQTYTKDDFVWEMDGETEKVYYINDAGYMTTGWAFNPNEYGYEGTWYYSNEKGELQKGWQYLGGKWFYLGEHETEGMACDTWRTIDEKRYYFNARGEMVTGWYNAAGANSVYGNWVYCNADGSAYDGWVQSSGKWYYVEEGRMLQDSYVSLVDGEYVQGQSFKEDAKVYYLGRDGAMITGWYDDSYKSDTYERTSWLYANPDGTITKQWVWSGDAWYYVDSDGEMVQTGTRRIYNEQDVPAEYVWDDNKTYEENHAASAAASKAREDFYKSHTYVFGVDGKMVVGWTKFTTTYGETWYHADSNGVATSGWVLDGGKWYYCNYGRMLQNEMTPDGYYVGADGVWVQ